MAIQIDITLPGGILVSNAYCKITRGFFDKDVIIYYVSHYKSQASSIDRQNVICGDTEFSLAFTEDAMSLSELYAHLKLQAGYQNGVDV